MIARLHWLILSLLLLGGLTPAQGTRLVVTLTAGEHHAFEIDQITALTFTAESLRVGTRTQGHLFAVADIADLQFIWTPTGVEDEDTEAVITRVSCLLPNSPNPFSVQTRLAFDMPQSGPVSIRVYGVDGRLVRNLLQEDRSMGRHTVDWDGRDNAGHQMADGVYFYRLIHNGIEDCRKMVLIR